MAARYLIQGSGTDGYQTEDAGGVLLIENSDAGYVHGPAGGGMVHRLSPRIIVDTTVSSLPASIGTWLGNDVMFPINEAGTSKKVTGRRWRDWAGNMIGNRSVADAAPPQSDVTYLLNSAVPVPVSQLRIGTFIRWTLIFSKTAASTQARTHRILVGTTGDVGDAALITLTSGTPSAVVDVAHQEITLIIRGPLSASCLAHGASQVVHQSSVGLFANETEVLEVTSGTFDATTANLIVGLAVTTGTEVLTYHQVLVEAYNL